MSVTRLRLAASLIVLLSGFVGWSPAPAGEPAAPRGGQPDTLYVLEPEPDRAGVAEGQGTMVELHNLDPQKVLRLARALGGKVERVLLVGCEPQPLPPDDDIQSGLSEPVRAAVEEAVRVVESLVNRLRQGSEFSK